MNPTSANIFTSELFSEEELRELAKADKNIELEFTKSTTRVPLRLPSEKFNETLEVELDKDRTLEDAEPLEHELMALEQFPEQLDDIDILSFDPTDKPSDDEEDDEEDDEDFEFDDDDEDEDDLGDDVDK